MNRFVKLNNRLGRNKNKVNNSTMAEEPALVDHTSSEETSSTFTAVPHPIGKPTISGMMEEDSKSRQEAQQETLGGEKTKISDECVKLTVSKSETKSGQRLAEATEPAKDGLVDMPVQKTAPAQKSNTTEQKRKSSAQAGNAPALPGFAPQKTEKGPKEKSSAKAIDVAMTAPSPGTTHILRELQDVKLDLSAPMEVDMDVAEDKQGVAPQQKELDTVPEPVSFSEAWEQAAQMVGQNLNPIDQSDLDEFEVTLPKQSEDDSVGEEDPDIVVPNITRPPGGSAVDDTQGSGLDMIHSQMVRQNLNPIGRNESEQSTAGLGEAFSDQREPMVASVTPPPEKSSITVQDAQDSDVDRRDVDMIDTDAAAKVMIATPVLEPLGSWEMPDTPDTKKSTAHVSDDDASLSFSDVSSDDEMEIDVVMPVSGGVNIHLLSDILYKGSAAIESIQTGSDVVVLVGGTGVGKSKFIQSIAGHKMVRTRFGTWLFVCSDSISWFPLYCR